MNYACECADQAWRGPAGDPQGHVGLPESSRALKPGRQLYADRLNKVFIALTRRR